MADIYENNTKLFGFDGFIARRDFLLNTVILKAISFLFLLPYIIYLYTKILSPNDLFSMKSIFFQAPLFLQLLTVISSLVFSYIYLSNALRRFNDICGKQNFLLFGIYGFLVAFSSLWMLFPLYISLILFHLFNLPLTVFVLFLIFKEGKISSKLQYDVTKEFNWGAFFGTWIWGLFNRSYAPLWMLLLFLSPWSFDYMLYCGLKGNEWAYKKARDKDIDKFNKGQEKQAAIWTVLACLFPIIVTIILTVFFLSCAHFVSSIFTDLKSSDLNRKYPPVESHVSGLNNFDSGEYDDVSFEDLDKSMGDLLAKADSAMDKLISLQFKSYEIKDKENKFYIDPMDWKYSSFDGKKGYLDLAANHAASKKYNDELKKDPHKVHKVRTKLDELPITKIYDAKTKKLLGEFVLNTKSNDPKEILKASMTAYKFYEVK